MLVVKFPVFPFRKRFNLIASTFNVYSTARIHR